MSYINKFEIPNDADPETYFHDQVLRLQEEIKAKKDKIEKQKKTIENLKNETPKKKANLEILNKNMDTLKEKIQYMMGCENKNLESNKLLETKNSKVIQTNSFIQEATSFLHKVNVKHEEQTNNMAEFNKNKGEIFTPNQIDVQIKEYAPNYLLEITD